HLNRWAEAESIFQQTAQELIQFGMLRENATVQQYRVEIAMGSGAFQQAIDIYSKIDPVHLSDQSSATLLALISEAYYQTGQMEQGRLHFRQACDSRAKASQKAGIDITSLEYIGQRQGFFAKGVRIALENDDIESAFESVIAAKGSLLGDLQSHRQRPMVPENKVVLNARRELGQWLLERGRSTFPGDDALHEPETLARMKDYLEGFRSAHPGSSGFDEPVVNRAEIHGIQDSLAEGWGILDFCRVDTDSVAVFLLTKSQFQYRRLKVPFETASFRANLIRFGKCIDDSMPVASDEILDDLYHYLFEPLLPLLEGLIGLYLVPHERLHYLPLHACRRFINGHYRYLNDDFEIAYLPSARILQHLPPMNLDGSLFSLANPDLGTPKTLPFAHWEHQWMKQAFPNRPIRGYSGPRATHKSLQGWSDASLIHFSCHGAGEHRDVAFSRLHLADDVLLAHDVIHHMEPLKSGSMVVLNGCQTARLDDRSLDESMGLATAFLMRGAGLTLSTTWSVDDCCAAEFVTCFLDHLLKNGLTPTQAMRQAQGHVRGLSSDHLSARENHLLRLFPAIDFPFEAASIHRRAAWRLMRSGKPDEAREHGQLAAEAMRLCGNPVPFQSILDAIGKAVPQNESSAFDHPIYWSAFRLIGRAH
ncbi:MAG: CHAT domain-containing protein, partial [Planctomycetota bacterium]